MFFMLENKNILVGALKNVSLLFFNDDNHVTFIAFMHSYIHSCVT